MYCMMHDEWMDISRNMLKHVILSQNKQNRQQNKLVNMVNGNDLINISIGHIYIWLMFSEPRCVKALNWVLSTFLQCIYILKFDIIAAVFENVCILASFKIWSIELCSTFGWKKQFRLFLHNLGVLKFDSQLQFVIFVKLKFQHI